MTDLLIKNIKLLCNDGNLRLKDVYISNEKIIDIKNNIRSNSYDQILDAKKNIMIPSGIDTNVHISNMNNKEEWYNCSCSAIAGGITTIITQQDENASIYDEKTFDLINNYAKSRSIIDYGINGGLSNNLHDINNLYKKGIFGIGEINIRKENLLSEFENLKRYLIEIRKHKLLLCISSNNDLYNKKNIFNSNLKLQSSMIYDNYEFEEIYHFLKINNNINKYKENTKLHFCSLNTEKSLIYILSQKYASSLYQITCDINLFQLLLNQINQINPIFKNKYQIEFFLNNLKYIDIISSGSILKRNDSYLSKEQDFSHIELTIPLMLYLVHKNYITLNDVIRLISFNPSKIFNIKNKGTILKNYDADLLIYNPKNIQKIKSENLYSKCQWTLYKDIFCIFPEITISRGEIIWMDKQIITKKGRGHLIQRG